MNNIKELICAAVLNSMVCALASCSHDDQSEVLSEESSKVSLDVVNCLLGRVARSTDFDIWDMYDQIGVTMCRQLMNPTELYREPGTGEVAFNRCYYTTTSGSSEFVAYNASQKIWFPSDTTKVRFVGYYPYAVDINQQDGIYHLDLRGQTDADHRLSDYDLLWGEVRDRSKYAFDVNFNFAHQLTQVVFYIEPKGDLTIDDLKDAVLVLTHQRLGADFNIYNAQLSNLETDGEMDLRRTVETVNNAACLVGKAIILPNDAEQNPVSYFETDDVQLSEARNRHIVMQLPGRQRLTANLQAVEFKPGEKHVFYIEATSVSLSLIRGEISPWNTVEHDVIIF